MEIATIGFTQSSAETFFGRIVRARLPRVVDIRLHNRSQLAGFAKAPDIGYFLATICDVEYVEAPELAPDPAAFEAYRAKEIDWDAYARRYLETIEQRKVEDSQHALFEKGAILLCSEHKADRCHRRLAAEYLAKHWREVTISHL